MKSIIDTIFYNYMETITPNYKHRKYTDEEMAREQLTKTLDKKQKELLLLYEDNIFNRHCADERDFYVLGFRMGAKLAFELMNSDSLF